MGFLKENVRPKDRLGGFCLSLYANMFTPAAEYHWGGGGGGLLTWSGGW